MSVANAPGVASGYSVTVPSAARRPILSPSRLDIGVDPPVEAHATTFSGKVDRSMNPVVATFTDADPNTRARDYSVTISWGDGQTSAGTVTRAGDGSFVVRGRHVYFRKGTRKVVVSA
jgi:hypothetical protein